MANGKWSATKIGDIGGLIFAGRFIKDAKYPQIVIAPGDGSGPVKWYECKGNPLDSKSWIGHDLVGRTMIHPHSLQVADIDGDGNLDIFVAEMAKWTESKKEPDNPKAQAFIFYGDGKGNFRKTVFATGMGFHEACVADLERRRAARYPEQALQLGHAPGGRLAQPGPRTGGQGRWRQRQFQGSGRSATLQPPGYAGQECRSGTEDCTWLRIQQKSNWLERTAFHPRNSVSGWSLKG